MSNPIYNPGDNYENIKILGINKSKSYFRYDIECLLCGKRFAATAAAIKKSNYCHEGCPDCKKKKMDIDKLEKYKADYISKQFGNLFILDVFYGENKGHKGKTLYAKCKCSGCGQETNILLTRIIKVGVKECSNCIKKHLEKGKEVIEGQRTEGTLICAIDGRKRINANNTSGYNGVNYHSKTGKYRAYINLAGKQKYLGLYDTPELAHEARLEAEKTIYKPIIDAWSKKQKED